MIACQSRKPLEGVQLIRFRCAWMIGALALLAACAGDSAPATQHRADPPAWPVQAVEIAPRDLSRSIQVSAAMQPLRTIRLASRSGGILTGGSVETGDTVRVNQPQASVDVSKQAAELNRARASAGTGAPVRPHQAAA
jgi:multidrug efflux pump subunit AcrA (membrane-fusion protein)